MQSHTWRNHRATCCRTGIWLCSLILLGSQGSFGQNKQPIEWTKHNLLWTGKIWTYESGIPKAEYFDPHYDDQNWKRVHTDSIHFIIRDKSTWQGIGVFRHKFDVPDSLRGKRAELILLIGVGALEIYLDGKLISRYGKVAASAEDEIVTTITTPQNPTQVDLDDQPSHVITVYYSNHNNELIRRGWEGFVVMFSPLNPTIGYTKDFIPHHIISMCIILAFCLFFWFVYAFYPYRLASLICALYVANFSLVFVGGFIRQEASEPNVFILGENIFRIGFASNPGWSLLFLYAIYFNRLPKRSWIVVGLMTLSTGAALFSPELPFHIIVPIIILLQVEAWRILILGIIKKKTGFWILAIGFFISLVGSLVAIFDIFNFFPWYITTTQTALAIVTDLSFPLTLALHFAWEFGSANRDLRLQLASVSDLSRKNLEQEQEKQDILSLQNETLEKQVAERTSEVVAQNKEIEKQRDQVTTTLEELRSTQKQLIQSEKMASLGELTAGIAHEIQNPLNFVNNFSEVNRELLAEMNEAISKGDINEAQSIAKDVINNQEKINHHGKRADSIVKGMLQHSRGSSGQKEPADINALCDEYLRLSYHGFRAKEKTFNAKFETDFDTSIDKLNVVPQDIGRVVLNLINNAFYAVSEKKESFEGLTAGQYGYEPTVTVTTRKSNDKILISVKDNGNGITQNVLDKIFQPFFTTKPTGQGTGLGLSLSYDIVKAHGGELKVKTMESEGSEFAISIPIV